MQDNRLILRVLAKLMLAVGLLFLGYVFVVGLIESNSGEQVLRVDVSAIKAGEAGYFQAGRRKLIVVRNSPVDGGNGANGFFVGYAQDSVYGCEVRLDARQGLLKSQCADVAYSLDGRLIKGTPHHENLQSLKHHRLDTDHLLIRLQ